jgi:RNA polymerase sigma factor (sigma-70 family)
MDDEGRTWFDKFLSGLRKGDSSAWSEAFRRYYAWLKRSTKGRLSPKLRRKVDRSDIAVEAFERANRGIHRFKGHGKQEFEGWLRGINTNVLWQYIRHFGRIKRNPTEQQLPESGLMNGSALATGQRQSNQADLSELVKPALDLLSEIERRRFLLFHDKGLSYAEIALEEPEPVTEMALRTQVMRTRKKLRRIIDVLQRMDDQLYLEDQKQAVCLSYFQKKGATEIARTLNLPRACVEHWIDDARESGLFDDGDTR